MRLNKSMAITPYKRSKNPNINYFKTERKGEIDTVIARLSSTESRKYSKLASNLREIKELEEAISTRRKEVEDEARDLIQDLFEADDIIHTRVVETVSFILTLSKQPKPTTSVKYAEVLKELEQHLTPELIKVLENIKTKFSSVSQKSASLKTELNESSSNYLDKIEHWASKYDKCLDHLKDLTQ